jgi:organic radical activating enzyme
MVSEKGEKLNALRGLDVGYYPVMEHFYTIQGEGFHSGQSAYFIRLAGCDVGCVWCDVKESWKADGKNLMPASDLADAAVNAGAKNVVITGGEPTEYDLTILTDTLRNRGLKVWLETSGAFPILGSFDWVCVSPKKFKNPLTENLMHADELKVIVYNSSDFLWAEQQARLVAPKTRLFLQPEYGKRDVMMPAIIDYVKFHPQWSISLQTHKYLNIP